MNDTPSHTRNSLNDPPSVFTDRRYTVHWLGACRNCSISGVLYLLLRMNRFGERAQVWQVGGGTVPDSFETLSEDDIR
jgi:hypothetical protein